MRQGNGIGDGAGRGHAQLTPRELEIVRLLSAGVRPKQIARRLVITEATARTHIRNMIRKFQVSGVVALLAAVRARGVVQPKGEERYPTSTQSWVWTHPFRPVL